jgi:isoquinoline 1-oxidoreductase alpha subunit
MIMAAAALIDRSDSPTDAEIDAAVTNICRCGVYPRLREAIRRAARIKTGQEAVEGAPPPSIRPEDAARAVPALRAEPRRRRDPPNP